MNFFHEVFYIAIFNNMVHRQRARYRVARYVIVNNVAAATLESKTKNEWKRHWQKRNGNSFNRLYLGVSDSFKDGSSKLNNHSAMAVGKKKKSEVRSFKSNENIHKKEDGSYYVVSANKASSVSLFLRFLFNLNFVLFYGCFPLDFVWKWYEIKL